MKNFTSIYLIAVIFLTACNNSIEPIAELYDSGYNPEKEVYSPNLYNDLGLLYQKLYSIYQLQKHLPKEDIYEHLQNTLESSTIVLQSSKTSTTSSKTPTSGDHTNQEALTSLINNSPLSNSAKESITIFIQNLGGFNGTNKETVLQYIELYDTEVVNDSTISLFDRQVILTFSALVKNNHINQVTPLRQEDEDEDEEDYHNDEDWNISIGNMVGYLTISLSETPENMTEAILNSLKRF